MTNRAHALVRRHRNGRANLTISAIAVVSALAVVLAGCGSSSSSSSTSSSSTPTTTSTTSAAAAKATVVKGVKSPAGAVAPSKAGLAKLVKVSKGVSPHLKGLDNVPITQAIPTLSGDQNAFWSQEFANSGVQWPTVQDVLVQTTPAQTQCSTRPSVAPTDPMLLCYGQAATFFWTVPWMQQNVDTDTGGVNLLLGMAGMYGYAVQDLFGVYKQEQSGQVTASQAEQQNLCLVGIYARSVNQRSLFEQADVPTVKTWLSSLNGGSTGATGQQLQQAFSAGFNSGSPSSCGLPAGGGGTTTTSTTPTTPTPTTTSGTGPSLTTP